MTTLNSRTNEKDSPLAAFIDGRNYWIHYPQEKNSRKVRTVTKKGTVGDLKSSVPKGTKIFDMTGVSVIVMLEHRPREVDRDTGRCSYGEFLEAITKHGATQLW